jgi:hypothetical protein
VPWCDDCDRFFNPNSMPESGDCPTCGRFLASPVVEEEEHKVPWHFWLLLVGVGLYLGWRAVQGIVWVAQHV